MQRLAQFGQSMQTVAQAGEVARASGKQRDASGDAFDVGKTAQRLAQLAQAGAGAMKDAAAAGQAMQQPEGM